jgi:phosphoglycolate phosphatase-like HAD superfamily hydrolase
MMNYLASFDIDNTLIQSSAGHVESLIIAIKDIYGLATRIDVINHHGMTDQEIIIRILQKYDVDDKIVRSKLKKCICHMQLQYAQIVQSENIVILEGVYNLLTKLDQKGFLLGLVTGNLETIARAKLKKIGVNDFFKFGGFGSDHISRAELVKIAIRRAGNRYDLDDNNQIFHFGDAPQDMRAAREAGVTPIGVTTGVFAADDLESAGAYQVVPNLKNTDGILQLLLDFSHIPQGD